ncbi:MAG: hypothetical protein AVDCRST_MAG89-4213 [uncultured Gemmatimonadetes bacterium]|uniref:Uncharacterized protein n=1 Tax=uncultured Gemmatimonadota bacterium TaxID=203437 RepID=A0A6J4MUL7_9BACT|nr:MAG: hypothetical protein AVDCRST_MAG89-4213 [uncultured Gemmatimonadota bacterium]
MTYEESTPDLRALSLRIHSPRREGAGSRSPRRRTMGTPSFRG